jgi:NitT/TauT family transport system permease protein
MVSATPRAEGAARSAVLSVLSVVVLLAGWEVSARVGWIREAFFPRPSSLLSQFQLLLRDGTLGLHMGATVGRLFWAFVLAAVPGVAVGLAMGVWRAARDTLDPLFAFVYPIPSVLFLPLAAFVLGRGEPARVLTSAVTSFFLVATTTMAGVRQLDRGILEAGIHYGATGHNLFFKVLLPGALPWIFTGLRLGLGFALIVVVAVEMVGAERGLGALLWLSWQTLKVRDMYVTLLTIGFLGLLTTYGLERLRSWLLPWQPKTEVRR